MELLRKFFPFSFVEKKDVTALVINVLIHVVVGFVVGLVFGLLDLSAVIFLFLPLFGQKTENVIQGIPLLSLTGISSYLATAYYALVIGMIAWGILTLALQNNETVFWMRHKSNLSLLLNAAGAFLFVISTQPYAATYLLTILAIKVIMLIKKR